MPESFNWWAESLGAAALVINFIGYRQADANRYRAVSAVALLCVSLHFFLLGAMAAGIGCLLASIRNVIALRYRNALVVWAFVGLNLAFLALEWWVLQHGPLIFIAYASSLVFTVGSVVLNDAHRIRQWFVLAEGLGLIYALLVGSVFGTLFNLSNLISILTKLASSRKQY